MKQFSTWLVFLLVSFGFALRGQEVAFYAETDARQVVEEGSFQVFFILKNATGSGFKPPSFKDFSVLGGPMQSRDFRMVNGQRSQSISYGYYLMPKRKGKLTIGSASIKVNGKTVKTKPVQVEVVDAATKGATGDDLATRLEQGVYLQAEVDTPVVFVGEQVNLDFKLYTQENLDRLAVLREPEFEDIYVTEMQQYSNRPVQEVIKGQQFTTKILRKLALFPLKPGVIEVDPMVVQVGASKGGSSRRSFFFDDSPQVLRNVVSEPLTIEVRTLPNPPESFTGGIGDYDLSVLVDKNRLTTDDALSVILTVQGEGDIKQVQAPKLEFEEGAFEVYDPKGVERVYENNGKMAGLKTFEYLLLPKKTGPLSIRPVFTYFDTNTRSL